MFSTSTRLFILTALLFLTILSTGFSQVDNTPYKTACPKIIIYNPDTIDYQEIFNGEKDSVAFYSGVVTLKPNASGSLHSTEIYEEMIIVLSGEGQVRITNGTNLDLKYGHIAFIPPYTEHQVFNTGTGNLKYIYIATKSKKE